SFTGYDFGPGVWSQWTSLLTVTSLNAGVTFYFQVKARDTLGRETAWLNLSSRTTSSGPDTVPPAVEDYENDPEKWAGSSSGLYDVDFTDVLGSGLDRFQVKLSTSPALAGTPLIDWTDAVTLASQQEYRDNWPLPAAAFQTITEGVTAYVSVRVYDTAPTPNFTVSTDVFQVNRDTTPPVITNNAASPAGWLLAAPGAFDVDFADALSGLDSISYSASVLAGAADASVIPWTDIDSLVSSRTYAADWSVAFASLTGGATNYISVRAVDRAGNAVTLADAFRIMKAAGSPGISVISPSSGTFISTASLIYGSATGGNDGISVSTVEVRIQALASGKYYDGDSGGFTSVPPVWLKASGAETWTL
ncbi:MAG TPA: hypothetical protein PL037_09850, partial [Elusimicrobiales bacterium]|nr:hypothetical protein [Elusimicrobiales bacterium]